MGATGQTIYLALAAFPTVTDPAAPAAPAAATALAPLGADPLATPGLMQLTLSLAAVVLAIFVLGWLLKRFQGLGGGTARGLAVVGNLAVGQRERVVLLQAGEKQLLIGVSPGRVETLHVLDEPLDVGPAAAPAKVGFGALLATMERKR